MNINFWTSIEQNDESELQDILKKETINESIKDSFGLSPIHLALSKSNIDVAKILIENGFDVILKDKKGQTPFHYCSIKFLKQLLKSKEQTRFNGWATQ